MSLVLLRPLEDYLNAKRAYDSDALVASLTSDAVIVDEGTTYTGAAAIRAWNDRASKAVKATYELEGVEQIAESFVLTVKIAGNFPTSPVTLYFYATLRDDKIATMNISDARIPKAVAAYIQATNAFDTKAAAGTFLEDALVNDDKREFRGLAAIEHWFESESARDRVTLSPVEVSEHHGNVTIRAKVDGNYDETGLPGPLILTYYFSTTPEKISQLIIIFNKETLAA